MIARLASLMLAAVMAVGISVPSSTAYATGGKIAQTTHAAQTGRKPAVQTAEQGSTAQSPVCGQPWNQTDAGTAIDPSKAAGRLVGCISGSAVQYRLQNSTQWQNVQADANGHVSFDYTTKIAQFRFDAQFSIPKGTISAGNRTFHYRIAGFKGTGSAMFGTLNDGLGAYTISADGLVAITFSDQAIASNANAPLDNGRLYIEADRSKVTGGNPGQTILDFGNGHITTIDMYRKSGTPVKQTVGTPTQKLDGTLRAMWRILYANTGTIDQPIVKIEDWMAYENVSGDGSSVPGRGWYSADDIESLYQTLTGKMGAGTLDVYPVTVSGSNYQTSGKASRWQPGATQGGTTRNGTYWKWVFQPDSYVVKPGQTLELQYDSTFANSALHPASKNTSRLYLSDKKGDYYTKSAVVWNPLRPRITLAKTAGSQRIPSADECRTLGVASGGCALASWNVTVGNSGKGDLPVGWIVQDTGNGVWYTKDLLRTSLKVAVNGTTVTGTIQVSSNGGKNWTDLDQVSETTRYTSFRFIAGSVLAPGVNASVTYESLFDPAGTSVRRNSATAGTGVGGSFANAVTANVQAASLVKDGCSDPITTAGAPKFTSCGANGADYTINVGGDPETSLRVGWRISAHVTDNWRKSPLVFDETLPEGLRDVRFAFSDYANNKKWLGVEETTFTNVKGVQYRVELEKTGDRTYRITIPQQASDLMNEGNVYLYVAATGPDINDGAYWTEGRYDGRKGCVADSSLRAGAGDCLTIRYRNTVSMRSGTIPSVSTSETVTNNFRKTNSGVGDKQNIDSDWAADGKSLTRTYYVRANRYGLNIDPSHKTHNGTADPDKLPIKDVLTVPAAPEGSNPQVTFLGHVTVCLAWIGNGQACPAGKTYQPSPDAIIYRENDTKLGGTLTVYVPDSTPVTISYQYGFKGSAGFDVRNTAQFANTPWTDAGKTDASSAAISSSGVSVTTSTILLHKTDDNASGYRDLSGAKFELLAWNGHDYASATPKPIIAVTDKNGMIVVGKTQGLQCGTAYRVKEIEAPAGYEINTKTTDFYLTNCGAGTYYGPLDAQGRPDPSVHRWGGGYTMTVRDRKITGSVTWSKVDYSRTEEYLTGTTWRLERKNSAGAWEKVNDSLDNFADCTANGTTACTGAGDKDPAAGRLTVDNLDWGTYRLTEITAPGGYQLPDSTRTWAEFTIDRDHPKAQTVLKGHGEWAGIHGNRLTNQPEPVSALPVTGHAEALLLAVVAAAAGGGAMLVLAAAMHIRKRAYGDSPMDP